MSTAALRHACLAIVAIAGVAAAAAQPPADPGFRGGRPPLYSGASDRAGQPAVMTPPPTIDAAGAATAGFASAYARARSPRIVLFWNRELTDDVETDHEAYVRTSSETHATASGRRTDYDTPWAAYSDTTGRLDSRTDGELRAGVQRLDRGRRDAPDAEAIDFDVERGFTDALRNAGTRLVDRTAIMRAGALGRDAANAQAIETRAVMSRAELTLEIVPLDDPREDSGVSYKILARDLASGRVVANLKSTGRRPVKRMPYVAGEHGFVRATPAAQTAYDRGRQMALDTMAALTGAL